MNLRATSSLPMPLSPVIRTFASDRATRSISSRSSREGRTDPINCAARSNRMRRPIPPDGDG